ncbi:MAG: Rieske 2Fe-2S domain-containing protein, partial [Pirellulales bacterium]|nr:Rieske 2Fe-2S domain-containing protein [Pirellulales bacterium]
MSLIAERRSAGVAANPPDASEFPSHPATWYLFGRSNELQRGPVSKAILQRRLVAYRTATGGVSVLDASCAHLGADLGRGTVVGDAIQCPFHHWRFSPTGACVSIPNQDSAPTTACVRSYPAVERHGYIFFFFGPRELFPLPFFSECDPAAMTASKPFRFEMDCPWYMLAANGFDTQHFHAVHDRKLKNTPRVDCPTRFARRMRFDAEVTGTSAYDRFLKRFVGREVQISITSWGGPHVLVEGVFGRAHSRLLVTSQPLDERRTLSEVIVFAKRSRNSIKAALVDRVNLRIRRRFTQAFMRYDIDKLAGVRYHPHGLTPQDR